ncbi:MAG: extracellular solute-binding protein [Christensenellales bacterium]
MQQRTLIAAGPKTNTVDLFITGGAGGNSIAKEGDQVLAGYDNVVEPLDDVYATVMENGLTFEQKMIPTAIPYKIDGHYYDVPWSKTFGGLLYNKTLFDQIGIASPQTTDDLVAACETIKNYYAASNANKLPADKVTPFVFSAPTGYWNYLRDTWWTQYEGGENITNFFNGISIDEDGNMSRSKEIFRQTGRLRALEVLDKLINRESGNSHENVNTATFTEAQAGMTRQRTYDSQRRLVRERNEERCRRRSESLRYPRDEIPVISSITEKCEVVKTEAVLKKVIAAVDKEDDGESRDLSAITEIDTTTDEFKADYERIQTARHTYTSSVNLTMFIPVYATAKDLAKEFMVYLASDEGLATYIDNTSGNQMPFRYDLEGDTERWNNLSIFQKDLYEKRKTGVYYSDYAKAGVLGIEPYTSGTNITEIYFTAKNYEDRKTPQTLFQDEYDYWTDARWTQIKKEAGLS